MVTVLDTKFSPVDIEERKKLDIRPGDTVRVFQKIKEGDKTRLQAFEGLVLARKHGTEPGATFTVRKVASGVGVERIFPLYSPVIEKIEVLRRGKVRRAKLYYIREKAAKEARRKMRQSVYVGTTAEEEFPEKPNEENAESKGEVPSDKEEENKQETV